jgi:hypothetical protein
LPLYTANKTPSGGGFEDACATSRPKQTWGGGRGVTGQQRCCPKEKKRLKKEKIQSPDCLYPQETLRFTCFSWWIGTSQRKTREIAAARRPAVPEGGPGRGQGPWGDNTAAPKEPAPGLLIPPRDFALHVLFLGWIGASQRNHVSSFRREGSNRPAALLPKEKKRLKKEKNQPPDCLYPLTTCASRVFLGVDRHVSKTRKMDRRFHLFI